jgi:hypothetical protein
MPAQPLHLEVAEFTDADHWRWLLREPGGPFLADHAVALDRADPHYPALVDLPGYVRHYAAPDKREAEERRLIHEIGVWMGERVLGRSIADRLARARPPVVVRVRVPPEAGRLLSLPLEIARRAVDEDTLTRAGVCFVFEMMGEEPPAPEPVGERLRILALFSVPPTGSPLNLRRERQMLRRRVQRLVGASGLAVDLHVLQYGVTRDRLRDVLEQGEGWDVIHFSGHGMPGALVLEQPDGRPDEVTATDLARLLRQAGGRLKLATLSACLSAAASINQTLTWLGIAPDTVARHDSPSNPAQPETVKAAPTVARALTEALGCAVLGMRYAVEDDFAIRLADGLYDRLLRQRQPLPEAIRLALNSIVVDTGTTQPSALSLSAPALFGFRAADLMLTPPKGAGLDPDTSLAYLPREPAQFVGRVAAMTHASAALAIESDKSGVLLYGMAGAGKTACAIELIYHHAAAERFQAFVWYSAPEQGKDIALALRNFALELERPLPDLAMLHVIDREDAFRDWLPRLVEVLENNAILIALDNLESLLTETRQWRDPRWGLLIEAMLTPGGLSRTLLTSRIRPAVLPPSTEVIAVHALPRDEALLLVRELPNLRRLLDGAAPPLSPEQGRQLVRRVLRLVQGHPKLIELAEGMAKAPPKLATQLDQAEAAQDKGADELDAFFQSGETRLDEGAFLAGLHQWTRRVASTLPEPARLFFHFLCALEEDDREGWIIEENWKDVWQRLGRPAPAPALAAVLDPLISAGLVDRQGTGSEEYWFVLGIHPSVAEAGRADGGNAVQTAVDHELAAMWRQIMFQAFKGGGERPAGSFIVRGGLAAFAYLSRLGDWAIAAAVLEQVVTEDIAPGTISAVLPLAQRMAAMMAGTEREPEGQAILARVYWHAGRLTEAETLMRTVIANSVARGTFTVASGVSTDLAKLLRENGRLREAEQVMEQGVDYARRAWPGPWAQLLNEVEHLQLLNELGQHADVLHRVTELRALMQKLPDPPDENDRSVRIWNVREVLLEVGRWAAMQLKEWQQAFDLGAEILESERLRGAGLLEQTKTRFDDYGPLLSLKRYAEARELLDECRAVYEQENDASGLAGVFTGLAHLERNLNHFDLAKRFQETALRYCYAAVGIHAGTAAGHFNLANYLTRIGGGWAAVIGHRVAACLIHLAAGSGMLESYTAALADDLRCAGASVASALPTDFAALCATVEKVEGVRFRGLMQTLVPDKARLNAALHEVIATATGASRHQQTPGEGAAR